MLVFTLILTITFISSLCSKVHNLDFVVKEAAMAPDNFRISGIVINDQFPAPTIVVNRFDVLNIKLTNYLSTPFSLHWHGMFQNHTVRSDGVPNLTQNAIPSGSCYEYDFSVDDQVGTYWYHAHTGLDSEHSFGALIVKDDPEIYKDMIEFDKRFEYDDERTVLLSELWHKSRSELLQGLLGLPFSFVNNASSILTNGKTYDEWGTTADNSSLPFNLGYDVIKVKPNHKYRLRIIGALGFGFMKFHIPNHSLTIIEVDGTYIEPILVDHIELMGGQRYSVILKTDSNPDNYFITTQPVGGINTPSNGYSILHYEGAPDPKELIKVKKPEPIPTPPLDQWISDKLYTSQWYNRGLHQHYYTVPTKITKNIILDVRSITIGGHVQFTINDIDIRNFTNGLTPPLIEQIDTFKVKHNQGVYEIKAGENVQIVIQHIKSDSRDCIPHPWHLHGHSFYVVGSGSSYFKNSDNVIIDQAIDQSIRDKKLPILRDTFVHYPTLPNDTSNVADRNSTEVDSKLRGKLRDGEEFCSWTAIRFNANNKGTWLMHCHITAHLVMGKAVILLER